jgi:RsmE family RNA methyltransferase
VNLILLFEEDFVAPDRVRLSGRRREHVLAAGRDEFVVGVAGGKIGRGRVINDEVEMQVLLDRDPPPPLDITIILALPRPKVLNRVVAAAASMGVKRLYLINAWRVEKSYWKSPRLAEDNLRLQAILGLEQARDTILPKVELRRLFRPFVEDELPSLASGRMLVAHPYAAAACPPVLDPPLTLAVGPEGGFIEQELDSLTRIGFEPVTLGPRILRVETAIPALLGRCPSMA